MYKYNPSLPIQHPQYDYDFHYGEQVTVIDTGEIGYIYRYHYYFYIVHYCVQFLSKSYPKWMFWKDDELYYKTYQAHELESKSIAGTWTTDGYLHT